MKTTYANSVNILKRNCSFIFIKFGFENISVEENAGYRFLYFPHVFVFHSFGLLWASTLVGPVTIRLTGNGMGSDLRSDDKIDWNIGEALGNFTEYISSVSDTYNSSH